MFQKMLQGGSGSSGKNIELLTIETRKPAHDSKIEFTLNPEIITTPSKVAFAFGLGGDDLFSNFEKQNGEVIINDYITNSRGSKKVPYTISDNKVSTASFGWSGSTMGVAGMACLYE